jgi:hypothetical protein
MRLQFKQAVHLEGKDYGLGHHEVPDHVIKKKHKFIERLVQAGLILEGDAMSKPVSAETLQERQKRLAESLAKASKAVSPKSVPISEPAGEPVIDESKEETLEPVIEESSEESELKEAPKSADKKKQSKR